MKKGKRVFVIFLQIALALTLAVAVSHIVLDGSSGLPEIPWPFLDDPS